MKNDKKRMLLAGVLALSVLTGCSSASAASATSSMAASMAAASPAASSEVVSQPETAEGVVLPIAQGSLEEIKTGSYQFAADITNVDAKKRQMDMTVYAYDSYRAEDIDGLEAGKSIRIHPDGAVEAPGPDRREHRAERGNRHRFHQRRHRAGRRGPVVQQ